MKWIVAIDCVAYSSSLAKYSAYMIVWWLCLALRSSDEASYVADEVVLETA